MTGAVFGSLQPAPDDPVATRLVIVGCSAEKAPAPGPHRALELYDGGCVPALRSRLGHDPRLRSRVRFLSAEHGLVTADTPLRPYDRPLDPARAVDLRPSVGAGIADEMRADGVPAEVLVVAEPLYMVLLADLLALPERPRVHWVADHAHGWPQARAVLDQWGW